MLASAITMFLITEPIGRMIDKVGVKPILIFGTLMTAIGALLMIIASTLIEFIGYQIVIGIGLSALLGAPVRYVALSETNDMERASAQSLVSLTGSFGTMVGSTLAGAFLASHLQSLGGFHEIYLTMAVVAGISFLFSLALNSRVHSKEELQESQKEGKKQNSEYIYAN